MEDWLSELLFAFIFIVFGLLLGFLFGMAIGQHRGAALHYQGEWVCEVALGEVHCGPVEGE